MTMRSIDHVSLTVARLERSIRFYRDVLRLPLLGVGEEACPPDVPGIGARGARFRYADFDLGGGQLLELLHFPGSGVRRAHRIERPGGGHFGLRVADLRATLARLRRAGIPPRSAVLELDAPAWWAGAQTVYVRDPDGFTVELVERRGVSPRRPGSTAGRSARRRAGRS